jgi:NAD(P)H-dependent flavin oxidoreductase YrpB (nitropropane dioxygenase family)
MVRGRTVLVTKGPAMINNRTDTAFMRAFELSVPIIQGPMGGAAGPKLVGAVAEAGGLGVLPIWIAPTNVAVAMIKATLALTNRPLAVNLRADLDSADLITAATDLGVEIVHLFWGDPAASMGVIRQGGARMIATVSDGATTRRALDAGAAGLIAQGVEAGGHVLGSMPLRDLLPLVMDIAGHVPVAAAGGLTDAEDIAQVFDLGASAAVLGTHFVAAQESDVHPAYRNALVAAGAGDTVRTLCFDGGWPNAPHRVLRNSTFRVWEHAGCPAPGSRPGERDIVMHDARGRAYTRYHCATPQATMYGDLEAGCLYAGMGVGKIVDVRPVGVLIGEIMDGLARL